MAEVYSASYTYVDHSAIRIRGSPDALSEQPPEIDLTAPLALRESCLILREIMQVYDSGLLEDQTPEEQETSFSDVLEKTVNPMLEMCTMMVGLMKADRGEKAKEWDTAVFLVNCLVYLEVSMTLVLLFRLLTAWNGCREFSNHFRLQGLRFDSWRARWMSKFRSSWLPT